MNLSNIEIAEIQEYNHLAWRAHALDAVSSTRLKYLSDKWKGVDFIVALAETLKQERTTFAAYVYRHNELKKKYHLIKTYALEARRKLIYYDENTIHLHGELKQ